MNYLEIIALFLSTTKISNSLQLKCLKAFDGLSPEIIKGTFQFRDKVPYNFKQKSQYRIPPLHAVSNFLDQKYGSSLFK